MVSMDSLPNEILRKVMMYLTYGEMGQCLVISKRWQSVLEELLPATSLVFSSTGAAAEHWGSLLGLFHLLPDKYLDHPAYVQYSTVGEERLYLFCTGGWWWVGYQLGCSDYASLKVRQTTKQTPPEVGWQYFLLRQCAVISLYLEKPEYIRRFAFSPEIPAENSGENFH